MTKVGLVVLNYNDALMTKKFIKSIVNFNSIYKIAIVDNCSTDNSYDLLKNLKSDKVDIIKSDKNGGYSYGNNFGLKYLEKYNIDIFLISNPDVIFKETYVNACVYAINKYKYTMVTGVMYMNGKVSNLATWKLPSYISDILGCFLVLSKIYNYYNKVKIDYSKNIMDVEVIPGSLFAVSVKEFKEVGYFDENIFLYCEERIIAYKIKNQKYKIGLLPKIKYIHLGGNSINKSCNELKKLKILFNSRLYYQKKYNHINLTKEIIMKICIQIGIVERKLFYKFKKLSFNFKNKKGDF